jgi:multiple antibiotic resistance protein
MVNDWLHSFVMTFVPLFIVVDALGVLPFVFSATKGLPKKKQYEVFNLAIITAVGVGLVFLFFGQFILKVLGISVGSFAIAGGLILLIWSLRFIFTGEVVDAVKEELVAVVPIGTPLTVGPATITTLLLLATQYHIEIVLISFALNMLITWIIFMTGSYIIRFLGQGGLKAISKVFSLLLAAIAVSMVINGLNMLGVLHL